MGVIWLDQADQSQTPSSAACEPRVIFPMAGRHEAKHHSSAFGSITPGTESQAVG